MPPVTGETLAPAIPHSIEYHPESHSVALGPPNEPLPYALKPMSLGILC